MNDVWLKTRISASAKLVQTYRMQISTSQSTYTAQKTEANIKAGEKGTFGVRHWIDIGVKS